MLRRLSFGCVVAFFADFAVLTCLAFYLLTLEKTGPHTPNVATGQTILFKTKPVMTYISQTQVYILCGITAVFAVTSFIAYVKLANSFSKRQRGRKDNGDGWV
jgi:hypothetical protein